jgi:class 3 adenylate cyclase
MVHELMTVQRFREWAQNEPLPPNEYLEVQQTTLWFSDLTGSTALYARNGDPFAYRLVREHFDLLTKIVHDAAGAIVKTIGDGMMAVFMTGEQALRAALNANDALAAFNRDNRLESSCRLRLKIGIHTGPVIVVTLNDRPDYFGTTVNIASRVSNMAEGKEIVFSAATYAEPGVRQLVAPYQLTACSADVRGLDDPILVYRLRQ